MNALASVDELEARLEWELSPEEKSVAQGAIEDLSDDARYHGSAAWIEVGITPLPVSRLILKAAARFMRNPDGFTQSRAGDESVSWTDRGQGSGSPAFTEGELKILRSYGGGSPIISAPVQAWDSQDIDEVGYVPVDPAGHGGDPKHFPLFADGYI